MGSWDALTSRRRKTWKGPTTSKNMQENHVISNTNNSVRVDYGIIKYDAGSRTLLYFRIRSGTRKLGADVPQVSFHNVII